MAAEEDIPGTVRRLIVERLDTIPELEAVLLFREDASRTWTADQAGRRLYVSTTVAAHILEQLDERGFVVRAGDAYRYGPDTAELARAVDELAVTYARQLVAVTHLVHAKASPGVRQFADAFRLRRPKR